METRGISKLDLKRRNRKQILLAIREAGTLARVDIAGKLSLTRAAVTIITNQMIQQNILEDLSTPKEDPTLPKKKGRKKTMIQINPNYRFVLGVLISEDFLSIGLSNLNGEVLDKSFHSLSDSSDFQEITALIIKSAKTLMKKSSLTVKQILGLGAGIVPKRWTQMYADEIENGVTFTKLCSTLETELGVPVQCDSAVQLYALANINYREHEPKNQLLLFSGSEYRAAIIFNNVLMSGFRSDPQAINRYIITPGGASANGYPDGSVFAELSKTGIIRSAAEILGKKPEELTLAEIHEAYDAGDKKIKKLLDSTAEKLALLVYNFAVITRSQRVILQSFDMIPETEKRLRDTVKKLGKADSEQIELLISPVDPEHSFLAGSALAVEKLFFEMGGIQKNETAGGYN